MHSFLVLSIKMFISLIVLIIIMRFMGRKEMAQSTTLDFVFAASLANFVADLSTGENYNWWQVVGGMLLWSAMIFVLHSAAKKSRKIEKILQGEPEIIILHGRIDKKVMAKERITKTVLETMLREQGIFDIKEVQVAFLELSGRLSVMRKKENN